MLDTIKYVVEKARLVKINKKILEEFVSNLNVQDINISLNERSFMPLRSLEDKVNLLFIFSCINFAFWIHGKDNKQNKTFGMARSGILLESIFELFFKKRTQPLGTAMSEISLNEFNSALNSRINISLMNERWHNVREAGLILIYKYNHSYNNVLKEAYYDVSKALSLTIKNFPSFDDRALFQGKEIEFHKRAQVLLGSISKITKNTLTLVNVDKLLGGADYRIPQLLRHLKILEYSEPLARKVDDEELLLSGSNEEIEIRACTLWVIHLMRNMYNRYFKEKINPIELDGYLWRFSGTIRGIKPHHRVISINY
jgi:hypothetical protein